MDGLSEVPGRPGGPEAATNRPAMGLLQLMARPEMGYRVVVNLLLYQDLEINIGYVKGAKHLRQNIPEYLSHA